MTPRVALAACSALAASLVLAACGATTSGTLVDGSGTSAGAGPTGANATPTTAPALAQRLRSAADSITSSRFTSRGSVGANSFTASGVQRLSHGRPTAYRITEQLPAVGTLELLKAGGDTYIRLPASIGGATGKPWHVVSASSSNPFVRQFAATLQSVAALGSLDQFALFTEAVSSLKVLGSGTVGGAHATQYALTVDTAHLPASFPGLAALEQAGIDTLPIRLWIDDQGRPVRLTEKVTVGGQVVTTVVTMSHFDEPVTVTPPPASQVGSG